MAILNTTAEKKKTTQTSTQPQNTQNTQSQNVDTSGTDWTQRIGSVVSSDADYLAAKNKLTQTEQNMPGYAGTYDTDISDAYNKIVNRDPFRYNLAEDSLYQQYADTYMSQGKLAMKDTISQAANLTGGYGSSYGQAVGQQQYGQYLQGLSDVALDMYDRAYQRYQDEGDALKDRYSLASDMGNTEYGRYQDSLNAWNADRSFYADQANDAWNKAWNTEAAGYQRAQDDYNKQQTELNRQYDLAATMAAYGDFSGYADIFGQDRADAMKAAWDSGKLEQAFLSGKINYDEYLALTGSTGSTGGIGGGTGGTGGGSKTDNETSEGTSDVRTEWGKGLNKQALGSIAQQIATASDDGVAKTLEAVEANPNTSEADMAYIIQLVENRFGNQKNFTPKATTITTTAKKKNTGLSQR